jgi:hypothetical protein
MSILELSGNVITATDYNSACVKRIEFLEQQIKEKDRMIHELTNKTTM